MQNRKLGGTDLQVSVVGLGCNNFGWGLDLAATRKVVHRAIAAGINFFDTADIYGNQGGSESQLGEILGKRRKDIILATKFGMEMSPEKHGASRGYVVRAAADSLRRLRTEWIDLYQLHRPDPETPMEETLQALQGLVQQGKVRYIGCSNFSGAQLKEAHEAAQRLGIRGFVSVQNEYSLLVREPDAEVLPTVERYGMGFLPFFPLASGLLTGKYRRDQLPEGARLTTVKRLADRYLNEANWQKVERLRAFCEARGRALLELAFSWLLTRPAVASVIAGATKPEQVEQNAEASGWELTPEELAEVDRISG